ncbi:MAG: hypothetical protein NC250_01095 [Alistipes senegalensis]|nr:hypothetical protein [Bacteroides cellulosilyticus]MCM1351314.1 hypothetical protein [Alistipes senegalensis]
MKKYLFMLLAAAVLCGCEEDSKLNPNLLPKDEDEEVWVETGDISVDNLFDEIAFNRTIVLLDIRIKGYILNNYSVVRLVTKSGTMLYLSADESSDEYTTMAKVTSDLNEDNSWSFYVPVLAKEGTFDFVIELPASEQNTTVKLTRSFRTKTWRITMSRTNGAWSVDNLSLVPEQE